MIRYLILIAVVTVASSRVIRAADAPTTQPATNQAALEEKFAADMNNVTLVGHFTMDGHDAAPKEERYTISSVKKLQGDMWLFNARIQYNKTDSTIPLVIPVKWAGDTPIISVTEMGIPGMHTYSARVVIYNGRYAGTWNGAGNHGGTLFGRLEKTPATQPAK